MAPKKTSKNVSMWKLYQRKEEKSTQPISPKSNLGKLINLGCFISGFYSVYLGLTGFPHYYPGAVGFTLAGIACILLSFKR